MNSHPQALGFPFPHAPVAGVWQTVAAGVHWVRMPLPFALDHINLWVLDDEIEGVSGFTVIDCGATTAETKAAWEQLFDGPMGGRPVLRVIATHFHPDHLGLAHWLCEGGARQRWRAPLWTSAGEYVTGRLLSQQTGAEALAAGARAAEFYAANGLDDAESIARLKTRSTSQYALLVPAVPPSYHRLMGGGQLAIGPAGAKRVFRLLVGYGHSVEHLSLYCEADHLLVCGDMVLPRISTNVSVYDIDPDADPLPLYLRSLDHYLMLPADSLVLPSHGLPFTGLHRRVADQHAHHAARLDEVRVACTRPRSAAEIVPILFPRKLDSHQLGFALGEAIAHLHALWREGSLTRTRGADGVYRFVSE
ncbi:MAG: MBL fold metallo-hydrolase [Burkholderiaceae bacterium]